MTLEENKINKEFAIKSVRLTFKLAVRGVSPNHPQYDLIITQLRAILDQAELAYATDSPLLFGICEECSWNLKHYQIPAIAKKFKP